MQIGYLGPLQIEGGIPMRPRTRIVLAALGVDRGEAVSPERLADALWGERPPASWPKQVQVCVWDLRRTIGADTVQTVAGGYRLGAGTELDVDRFEGLIRRGHDLATIGEPDRATSTFRSALDLWRGRPFNDLDGWAPARAEVARLDELRRSAQEDLLEARLASGEHRDVVADAEMRVAEEPLRERRWSLLALAQYRSGNQGEALRTLRRARQTLVDELGLDPGADLAALETAILEQDPALLASERAAVSPHCPYQGLAPYDVDDSDLFFGRDGEIAQCLDRLSRTRLLLLAGPSGCGKSSLARAGLASALRRRGTAVSVLVPGADPDTALSAVLAATPGDPVVLVDQLEEVFAGSRSPAEIRAFCARLAGYAAERGQVIATIRSDHLGDLAADPALARLVEEGLHLVTPLHGTALRAAIEGPAATGLRLEPGLVELLVREAEDEPGALPLLSHALVQTWERRDGRVLTVDGYLAAGGISEAVARSAEQLFLSLGPAEQDRLRGLLLRLVVPAVNGAPIRTHLDATQLPSGVERDRLLELLVRARLVTADDSSIQLAHEALASAWPRLRGWVEEDVAGLRLVEHLARAASGWEALGRPDSELYRGPRLAAAADWRARVVPELTAAEIAFLEASIDAADRERAALADQAGRQARQNRRLRTALAGVVVFLAVALVAGGVAVIQRQQAVSQQRDAAVGALTGQALSLRTSRRDLAALLAVEAHHLRPDTGSEAALFGTFTASPGVDRIVHTGFGLGVTVGDAEYLPDGRTVAIGDSYGSVHLQNLSTRQVRALPPLSDHQGWAVFDVGTDGRHVAAAWRPSYEPETGVFTVWDLQTGTARFPPVPVDFRIGDIALSTDGSMVVVSGGEQGRVLFFDGATGTLLSELPTLGRPGDARNSVVTAALAFLPDGRLLVGSQAGPIRIVDPPSGQEVGRIDSGQETSDVVIIVSADVRAVLAAGSGGMARFDLATGGPIWPAVVADTHCNAYVVAEPLDLVICGQWTGVVTTYDLATGVRVGQRFDAQLGAVCALAISPSGDRLVEATGCNATDAALVEWSLDGGSAVSRLLVPTSTPPWISDLDSSRVFIDSTDPSEPPSGHRVDPLTAQVTDFAGVVGLAATTDPDVAVAIYDDGESPAAVGRYDLRSKVPAGPVIDPGFSFDQVWSNQQVVVLACCGGPQQIQTFDLRTGEQVGWSEVTDRNHHAIDMVLLDNEAYVTWLESIDLNVFTIQRRDLSTGEVLAVSPPGFNWVAANGGRVIAATTDGRIAELDPKTLQPLGSPFPGTSGALVTMSIDDAGRRLLVRAGDNTMRLYDIATRTLLGDPIDTGADDVNAALRGDGQVAYSGGRDGLVTWDLDPGHWAAAACEIAGRNLTRGEWDRYVGQLAPYGQTCPQYPTG